MEQINILIKPVSGKCNLNCRYCFYKDEMKKREQPVYGIMSEELLETVIRRAFEKDRRFCTLGFQGGEPLLAGLGFYEKTVELVKKYGKNAKTEFTIQTNGILIDDEWAKFFAENHFLVGISIDGIPKIHDRWRGKGTFEKVVRAAGLLQKHHVDFNVLTVVTEDLVPYTKRIYNNYKEHQWHYMQFIPCLDPLGEEWGGQTFSLEAESYGLFLKELFDCWYEDLVRGNFVYIRYFENLIGILLNHMPESCNMRGVCGMQNIVEADGSVYPCDFYVLDNCKLGNIREDSFEKLGERFSRSRLFVDSLKKSHICKECKWSRLCRGGCQRNREPHGDPDVFCEAYQMFFSYAWDRMVEIARRCC